MVPNENFVGKGEGDLNLPLISPFSYRLGLYFDANKWKADVIMNGATEQVNYSPYFGENPTPAYTVFNASVARDIDVFSNNMSEIQNYSYIQRNTHSIEVNQRKQNKVSTWKRNYACN